MTAEAPTLLERAEVAWNADDWDTMEAMYADGAVVEAPEGWPEQEDLHGWPAIRAQFERLKSSWSEERIELVEERANGDRLFAGYRWITKGEASGVPIEAEMFASYVLKGGLIERIAFATSRAEALAAAGIEEA